MRVGETVVLVDVLDPEGRESLGYTVPITVRYGLDTDQHYGADADGRRGVVRTELEVLQMDVNPPYLSRLNSRQVERLLADAHEALHRQLKKARPVCRF